jgi:adenine/guanine phosphoribosyltransferase-like PRPP-binding protein
MTTSQAIPMAHAVALELSLSIVRAVSDGNTGRREQEDPKKCA